MFDLSGKTALVTGASGGIGIDIARALLEQGAKVAMSGTSEEKLQKAAEGLPGDPILLPANLMDDASVDALVEAATKELGQVDIVVNNAGITRDMLAMRLKDEDWAAVLQVNLTSAFRLSRGLLRGMMKKRFGRIINITSVVGSTGNPGQANYAASKAGLVGMSKALAQEVASRGITVNCIAPGFIETPMTDALTDDQKKMITDTIPAAALGQPSDIAAAVVYLASDESRYITGQTLHINGGMAML